MPRPPNALVRAAICLGLIVAAAWTGLTACTDAGGYGLISLTVTGSGTGAGIVSSNDPGVDIQCAFPATAGCTDTFPDAAGGGGFNLIATPSTGSVFGAWTGCDLTSPGVCSLAFPASSGNTDYVVSVRFDLATTNTVTLYNATAGSAFLTLETESPRGNNLVASHESRDVNIPTTVGGQISFHAITSLVEGMPVASATCIVTATAWQNDTHPLVTFDNTDGNRLSCSEGLTGIIIQLPPP